MYRLKEKPKSSVTPRERNRLKHVPRSTSRITIPTADTTTEPQPFTLTTRGIWHRRLSVILSGWVGAALLSVLAAWPATALSSESGLWHVELLITIVLIRMIYRNIRGPRPVLVDHSVRRQVTSLLGDEILITIFLMATAFALNWPLSTESLFLFFAGNLFLQMSQLQFGRLALRWLATDQHGTRQVTTRRVMIVGTGERARAVADMILDSPDLDSTVVGFLDYERTGLWRYRDIPLIGSPDTFKDVVAGGQCDALFIAVEPEEFSRTGRLFGTAESMGVPICLPPNIYTGSISKPRATAINGTPIMTYRAVPENRLALLLKRTIDRVGAALGIIIASPIMLACVIAIKWESKGPILFKQVRSGRNGRPFYLYKFRTMCIDAERKKVTLLKQNEMSGPVFKMKADPRITRVGAFLRKYSLDELPQFFNVLKGEMSLVGPRPPLPREVANYDAWQRRRLSVKPGLTCLWQVNGRNAIDFEDWMKLDLQYIDRWSLWLDMKIMAKTIPTVLKGTGM